MMSKSTMSCVMVLLLSACSTKQTYENIQADRARDCNKIVHNSERAECLRGSDMLYKDYKRERAKLLNTTSKD